MKKYVIIIVALILLMGCTSNDKVKEYKKDYTPATTTLSGEEVEQKLQKLKIRNETISFYEDGTGTTIFALKPNNIDNYLSLEFEYTNWKVSEVMIYEGDPDEEEGYDSYIYYIKDNQNYSYISPGDGCLVSVDGKIPEKRSLCENKSWSEYPYEKLYKTPLKEAGIIKEDLITFGNYYYQKHKSEIDINK